MAFTIRGAKRNNPPKRRRSNLAPVDEGRRRGMPTNPFTTSMIDVLGCGFAAVFFLFLLFSSSERFHGGMANTSGSGALVDLSGPSNAQPPLILRVPAAFARSIDIPEANRYDGEQDVLFEIADRRIYSRGLIVRLLDRSKILSEVLLEALSETLVKDLKDRLLERDQFSVALSDGLSGIKVFAEAFETVLTKARSEGNAEFQAFLKALEAGIVKMLSEFPDETEDLLETITGILEEEHAGVLLNFPELRDAVAQAKEAVDEELPRAQAFTKVVAAGLIKGLQVNLFVEYGDSVQVVSLRHLGENLEPLKDGVLFSVRVAGLPRLAFNQDLHVLQFQPDPPVPISPLASESVAYAGGYHVVPALVFDGPTVRDIPVLEETRRVAISYWHAGRMFSAKLSRCGIVPNSWPTAIRTEWRFREGSLSVICDPTYSTSVPAK